LSALGIVPLLEAVSYLLAPRLASVPVWARPVISVVLVIPLMQYAVMPLLTRRRGPSSTHPGPRRPHPELSRVNALLPEAAPG